MLRHPNIDPIAFALGPVQVHWYGLSYLAAFALGWFLARRRALQRADIPLSGAQVDDMIFYVVLGTILGGRCGYVLLYGFERFLQEPLWLLYIWQGGMSFHGGFVGVVIALWLFSRQRLAVGALLDFMAVFAPLGVGIGRLGNFINQELWGRPTELPWGMVFPRDPEGLVRHPSQLYQFALEGVLLFALMYWFSARPRPRWAASGLLLLCWGAARFLLEFFRAPDTHVGLVAGWLSRGQLLCIPMLVGGMLVLWIAYRCPKAQA